MQMNYRVSATRWASCRGGRVAWATRWCGDTAPSDWPMRERTPSGPSCRRHGCSLPPVPGTRASRPQFHSRRRRRSTMTTRRRRRRMNMKRRFPAVRWVCMPLEEPNYRPSPINHPGIWSILDSISSNRLSSVWHHYFSKYPIKYKSNMGIRERSKDQDRRTRAEGSGSFNKDGSSLNIPMESYSKWISNQLKI